MFYNKLTIYSGTEKYDSKLIATCTEVEVKENDRTLTITLGTFDSKIDFDLTNYCNSHVRLVTDCGMDWVVRVDAIYPHYFESLDLSNTSTILNSQLTLIKSAYQPGRL